MFDGSMNRIQFENWRAVHCGKMATRFVARFPNDCHQLSHRTIKRATIIRYQYELQSLQFFLPKNRNLLPTRLQPHYPHHCNRNDIFPIKEYCNINTNTNTFTELLITVLPLPQRSANPSPSLQLNLLLKFFF